MPAVSAHKHRSMARMLGLLCSTALTGALLCAAPSDIAHAQALGHATGGDGGVTPVNQGGDGGDPGQPGVAGSGSGGGVGGAGGAGIGGDGLNGGDAVAGSASGGGGGGGGAHGAVLTANPTTNMTGGDGGDGGRGDTTGVRERDIGGGGGGGGGDAALFDGSLSNLTIDAAIHLTGGNGGDGNQSFLDGGGINAGGGGGGAGLFVSGAGVNATITVNGTIAGGRGGAGVVGGGGGAGVVMTDDARGIINVNGTISGGDGDGANGAGTAGDGIVAGAGSPVDISVGSDGDVSGGRGYYGGRGGAGLRLENGSSVVNAGVITGGDGGGGASSAYTHFDGGTGSGGAPGAISNTALAGVGGVGIVGAGLTVVNAGTIAGGIGFDEQTYLPDGQANAITFIGGINRLELQAGSTITGNVDATAGATDTFALGGSTDAAFDVSIIGGAVQYRGFENFEKTGASAWTLDGTGAQDWLIDSGTLVGDTNSFGGNITFGTGTDARGVTFDQSTAGTYSGTISGEGTFSMIGAGTLTLTGENEVGLFAVHDGTLAVDGGTLDQAEQSAYLSNIIGEAGGDDASLVITNGGKVTSANVIYLGYSSGSQGSVTVSGNGSSLNADMLQVGNYGDGILSVKDNGHASIGGLYAGASNDGTQGTGTFSVSGATADVSTLYIGYSQGSTGAVTVSDGGTLDVENLIYMGQQNTTGTADLNIGAASTDPADAAAPGIFKGGEIRLYDDIASLNFNHTGDAYVFDTPLVSMNAGDGFVHHYAGVTGLTGDSSGFSGDTIVHGGTLAVNGTLGGTVNVESGGTLGGSGTIGGNVDVDGILSAGNSPGTLTIDGNLALNSGSTSVFELNTPGVVGGTGAGGNDLVEVGGNLSLGGALDARIAAAGYYRLLNYDGTLTGTFDSGTLTGTGDFTPLFPNSPDIRYDTPHQVNLSVLAAGQTMLFWDGSNTSANGTVDGGDGTWNSAGANWTDSAGGANGSWGGTVGVFAGNAGTVTVDGTQSFDTLQFKTDGYELTGGTLALSPATGTAGALNIDNGVTTTIASTIADGTGNSLKKVGGGTLVLTGANTYTGGTQLLGGVLSTSSDDNLGDESGTLTFDGGTLQNTASFTSTRNITLNADGGTFQTDPLTTLTVSGVISGGGSLTKAGAGTLTLTGSNNYTGGTTVSRGALEASVTGALGNGPVAINGTAVAGAELSFTNSANAEALNIGVTGMNSALSFYDSASAGSATIESHIGRINFYDSASAGSATITADGGLSFNANSTAADARITNTGALDFYATATAGNAVIANKSGGVASFHDSSTADGATIANSTGGLVDISGLTSGGIGIGSLSGDGDVVLGSKALTLGGLNRNEAIGGAIQDGTAGTGGSLTKTGDGELTLNGVNTYTGLTTIDDGKLVVGDDSHAMASLAGDVFIDSGGTLGGIGTVGPTTVASGGTIAPGNSIGTLTVKGDITFEAGSTYLAEINPTLDSDLIDASGKATINGGTVYAAKAGGVYTPGSRWTIVGADGGVTGTFDPTVAQNMPFVDLALTYDATHVYLEATRNAVAFCDVAGTFNQCSTGDGLESLGTGNFLYDIVAALPDKESARAALDALSGEIYASTKSALIEDSHFVRDAVNDRIRSAFGDLSAPPMPVMAYGEGGPRPASPDSLGLVAWGHAFGSWGSFDGDGNAAAMDTSTGGFLAGIDGEIASDIRLGFLTGYSHSTFEVDGRSSSGSSDNYHVGLYAGGKWNALRLTGGLAYTWHDIETGRSVAFPGFSDQLSADYNAGTFQAFGEAGYRIDVGTVSFEPFANLAYVNLHTDGFTEKGGTAALHVRGETTETTFTTLGIHLSSAFDLSGMKATARGTLGWRHAFGDVTPISTHAFAGGDPFDIAGVPIAEDAAIIKAGLDLSLMPNATLGIAYQGQIATDVRQHGFNAKLEVRF